MLLACGPIGPFAGGRLKGEEAAWPADWSRLAQVENAQLETNPDDPHSINIWFVVVDSRPYLATSLLRGSDVPEEREWVRNVSADPEIRIRIDGVVYAGRVEPVGDAETKARVFAQFQDKYPNLDPARGDASRFYVVGSRVN